MAGASAWPDTGGDAAFGQQCPFQSLADTILPEPAGEEWHRDRTNVGDRRLRELGLFNLENSHLQGDLNEPFSTCRELIKRWRETIYKGLE